MLLGLRAHAHSISIRTMIPTFSFRGHSWHLKCFDFWCWRRTGS
jgi:hypothetical protein